MGSRVVALSGLTEGAQLEVLFGLHCAASAERPTRVKALQGAVNRLRAEGAASVTDVALDGLARDARLFILFVRDRITLASTTPAEEVGKDRWDLRVFGPLRRVDALRPPQPGLAAGRGQGVGT